MDSQNNIENITIRQVGDDTVNVTFTRFDNTNDLNDVIITKVKRVFIMTQQQKQIQEQLNKRNIAKELKYIISEEGKKEVLDFYNDLEKLLSKDGASKETASKIVNYHLESNS